MNELAVRKPEPRAAAETSKAPALAAQAFRITLPPPAGPNILRPELHPAMIPEDLPSGLTARGFKRMSTRAFLEGVNSTGLKKDDRPTSQMLQHFAAKLLQDLPAEQLHFAGVIAYCVGQTAALERLCRDPECDHQRHIPEAIRTTLEAVMQVCGGQGQTVLFDASKTTPEQLAEYIDNAQNLAIIQPPPA